MWSRYMRIRERDGIVAIFHELHPDPVFCSSEQWKKVVAGITGDAETFINDLWQRKLIVDSSKDDSCEFQVASSALERKLNQPTILYLMTAQGCNFKCTYCPVPEISIKYGESILSNEDASAGIDLWQEHLKDVYDPSLEYFVIFYGGEPLLSKEVIRHSLDYLKLKKDTLTPTSGNFKAQLVISASYGLSQVMYPTALLMNFEGTATARNVHDLFKPGVVLDFSTAYLMSKYQKISQTGDKCESGFDWWIALRDYNGAGINAENYADGVCKIYKSGIFNLTP